MTSTTPTIETHDFRKPRGLTSSIRDALSHWLGDSATLAAERWRDLNLEAKLTHVDTRTLSLPRALTLFSDPGWGVHAGLGATSFTNLLVSSPKWVRTLVNHLLGESESRETDEAPLSSIESSLAELLFQEFLMACGEAWPGAEPLNTRLTGLVARPRRTRLFPLRTTMIVITFRIECESDSGDLMWAMPQQNIEDLIEIECTPTDRPLASASPEMSQWVYGMPIPITVELGQITLSMTELASLQTGDVIVLDQASTHLLSASVGGAVKFRGCPGRLGNQRCLEIEEVLNAPGPSLSTHSQV